jgi:O-antigen/teichoic acid export membrane protein
MGAAETATSRIPTTPRAEPLARRLAKGAAVEVSGFGVAQILRFAANLVLTRLLFPQAFGLMAMLSLVLYGIVMLTDVGLAQAVIRSERGEDPVFLDTAWSIQALRGVFLWLVASLLAWPAAILFREPVLLYVIPIGSLSAAIQGLTSTRVFTLRRHLRPLPLVLLEISGQVTGLVATIALAYAGVGVWSLVAGTLVGAATHAGTSNVLPGKHRERFRIDADARREIARFGRWIYASSAVTFAAGRGDQLVLARLMGAASLGVYNIALALAELPDALVGRVIDRLLYPLYARVHNEHPEQLPRVYYRTRLALDAVAHTALGGVVALAPWLIRVLYDARYHDAAPILQILALRTCFTVLAAPCETALFAQGLSMYGFRRNLVVALCTFAAMPIGHALGGVTGLLWGSTVARAAAIAVLWPAARRTGILTIHRELLFVLFLAVGYGVGTAVPWILPVR